MPLNNQGPDFQGDNETIGTSAVLIYTASHRASGSEPENLTVQNLHASATVTVGGSDVADEENGIVLDAAYDAISIPLRSPGTEVYAISDTASTNISITRA